MTRTHHARSTGPLCTAALCVALLSACASPQEPAPAPAPKAAPATMAPVVVEQPKPAADPRAQFQQLSESLKASAVSVIETPDGRIKISVPSDLSFGLNSAAVNPAFAQVLDRVAENLNKFTDTAAEIVGHTDTSGRAASNKALSLKRAESTRDYLVSRNVGPDRLSVKGMGQEMPMADNKTREGRSTNRRVEIFVGKR